MKQGKIWGVTELLTRNPAFEFHRIQIKGGGFCSKHRHDTKWNGFYVIDGELRVIVWDPSGAEVLTVLRAGEYMEVPPGRFHKFEVDSVCIALELYWAQYSPDDITRESVGGIHG